MQEVHFGRPYIFEDIINYLEKGEMPRKREKSEILNIIIKHINLEIKEKGEYTGIREMRKHIAWYTKGMQNGAIIRARVNKIEKEEELIKTLTEYFN